MTVRSLTTIAAVFVTMPIFALAQKGSWRQYNGPVFSFSYPNTWHVESKVDQDVIVGDSQKPLTVEFAVSLAQAGDLHKMTLNAQKHVMQFAQAKNLIPKFESVTGMPPGGIRLISHLCSIKSGNLRFCAD